MSLQEYMLNKVCRIVETWDGPEHRDIYAISMYIYDFDDVPKIPTMTLGYNTSSKWKKETPFASSEDEAKWNFAFWLQNQECLIGDPAKDSEGFRLIQGWITNLGLMYEDDEDIDRVCELGGQITKNFVELCVRIARMLHQEGVIKKIFKRDVPIIIHELEYYDEIAEQTARANPQGVADEFVSWVKG